MGVLGRSVAGTSFVAQFAECARVPKPYLAKIVQALARQGLVTARRGVGGGVSLARKPEEITLLQIVEAVEGKDWLGDCLLGLDECTGLNTCPTHDFWQRFRREVTEQLAQATLASVINFRNVKRKNAKDAVRRSRSKKVCMNC